VSVAARLVFRETGRETVHVKTYPDVGMMKVDLDAIYSGNGWVRLRDGETQGHSFDEWVRAGNIVFYRSEVFNV
jgi:hypothetical protein